MLKHTLNKVERVELQPSSTLKHNTSKVHLVFSNSCTKLLKFAFTRILHSALCICTPEWAPNNPILSERGPARFPWRKRVHLPSNMICKVMARSPARIDDPCCPWSRDCSPDRLQQPSAESRHAEREPDETRRAVIFLMVVSLAQAIRAQREKERAPLAGLSNEMQTRRKEDQRDDGERSSRHPIAALAGSPYYAGRSACSSSVVPYRVRRPRRSY